MGELCVRRKRSRVLCRRETVAYPSKTLVRAWRKRTFPMHSPQKQIISFDEIDCNEARYRSLEVEGVYWDDKVKTLKVVSPWIRIFSGFTR